MQIYLFISYIIYILIQMGFVSILSIFKYSERQLNPGTPPPPSSPCCDSNYWYYILPYLIILRFVNLCFSGFWNLMRSPWTPSHLGILGSRPALVWCLWRLPTLAANRTGTSSSQMGKMAAGRRKTCGKYGEQSSTSGTFTSKRRTDSSRCDMRFFLHINSV